MSEQVPAISVIMPVYNGVPFVAESVQCILDQTYGDFEFIIIDDGSTDDSVAVIRSFTDPRIKLIVQANKGLAATLNVGIAHARGKWIARQDHDDVSLPGRFAKQMAFLAAHPDVGLLGTWATITDSRGTPIGAHEHPTQDDVIRYELLFDSPFVHASVMMAREVVDNVGGYDTDPNVFEDFDMWSRMIVHTHGANIPEHLVRYRELSTSISRVTTTRLERVVEQRRRNLEVVFPAVPRQLLAVVAEAGVRHAPIAFRQFLPVRKLMADHIRATIRQPDDARRLQRKLRRAMLGYRIVPHRTTFHRIADRTTKELLLFLSDFR